METETIGAFEAKTHFSRILRDVAGGKVFHITLRGKRVAVIKKEEEYPTIQALQALKNLSQFRKPLSIAEMKALRDEGRER